MTVVFAGLAIVLAGALAAAWLPGARAGERIFGAGMIAGCALCAVQAVRVVLGGTAPALRLAGGFAGGPWLFGIDHLSAAFLLVFLVVGCAATLYGITYLRPERDHRPVRVAHALAAILVGSLVLVVTARAVVPFLVAWEMMALSAYLLVVFESERAEARRAGLIYFIVTHAGTLGLVLMFALWGARAADLSFAALAAAAPALPYGGGIVFALALLGFGVKAGVVPFHFWLPDAHAAAPSHVSALMSGIVIKTGVYGMLRVISLAGAPPPWWGWTVLVLGLVSGVLGVVWALAQHDLKRLLAYHSVENIGIILLGLGAGALGSAYGSPLVATLGYGGALLHVLNHALFKSLLFLGAGSVATATGTRQIDRLGGLARAMPVTWLTFLVGSAAIVGLPPLNGFVSEWVVFQALLESGDPGHGPLRLAVFAAAGLGLIGALALACFAKVCGVVFLGKARGAAAGAAREAAPGMLVPMAVLAGLCVLIGVMPQFVVRPAVDAGAALARLDAFGALVGGSNAIAAAAWISAAAAALLAVTGIAWAIRARALGRRPAAEADTWACGYGAVTPRMQYTAASFAAPVLAVFGPAAGVHAERDVVGGRTTHAGDPVLDAALVPLWRRAESALDVLQPLRRSRLHVSLLLFVVTALVLLVYLAASGAAP